MTEGSSQPMPAAFLGHGSPMNALDQNRYTQAWKAFGASLPRARAILAISAHWYVGVTAVTAMPRPRTIHDFYGFPKELFDVQYPAPGDQAFAQEVSDLAKPTRVGLDRDSWGLDHGTWSVLVHAFPGADIPVVQLSLDARKGFDHHFELGSRLAALRQSGVLILGSGNIVHNLRALDGSRPEAGFDWAHRFSDASRKILIEKPGDAARLKNHPDFGRVAPTPDHFLPVLYLAGLAAAAGRPLEVLIDGYAYGSLTMTCYTLDARCPKDTADSRAAAALPDPASYPPEEANL